MSNAISARAEIITRRTYNRPKDDGSYETWEDTVNRVIVHQQWLWHRAGGVSAASELHELKQLLMGRKGCLAGRTMWLGGTELAKRREASQFNCSFLKVETVNDLVDLFWLLLQGCGVGFMPAVGTLNGFTKRIPDIEIIRSTRTSKGGSDANQETFKEGTWTIRLGDSAEAWAKAIGKLAAGKYSADHLVLDFSEVRPGGQRLSGYGWTSHGDAPIAGAFEAITKLMNRRAGQLLTRIDILDVVNWLGTTLSSRRAAEIALIEHGDPEWRDFAAAKDRFWESNPQRAQSNNSIIFYDKPSRDMLSSIFALMVKAGGSEPGVINGTAARLRAPWFSGVNPCGEVLLANKSFCNLAEVDLARYKDDFGGLERAVWLLGRASYRQTLVNLDDGILSPAWHQNNEFLRLCGVGLTGVVRRPDLTPYDYKRLRSAAIAGAYSMADELGTQRPKNVTTVKPSGTLSKIMDTTEGVHRPPGKYIFNHVTFRKDSSLVEQLRAGGYLVFDNPLDPKTTLVRFPVVWEDVEFAEVDGVQVNLESAVAQLDRYKMLMDNYCEQNVSITVSYDSWEIESIITWLLKNWDSYVGAAFLPRVDPTKTAEDIGYAYLPQEVVTKEAFDTYVEQLRPIDLNAASGDDGPSEGDCASGSCPVR